MKSKKGTSLWEEAKKIIPGGSQLLSKRSEQFLPDQWPSYFDKAKGVEIYDLDGNKFVDMSIMGVGTSILGYADDDVNQAVRDAVEKGTMSTLNNPEEVELADLLLELHSWADMVRYTRTGGEAMALAVRIARATSRKDKIAFCGYHGWHDWYLASNIADKQNLEGHLLPGLDPLGVPNKLRGTALPFNYNNIQELEEIVENNDIGTIVVEPVRHHIPRNGFLGKVKEIAGDTDAVLVFDEITSGWRVKIPGVHERFGVHPDVVVYGKAMSNGFPMSAIVGKKKVMDKAQDSFISSTYWTDRIGPVAALATLKKLRDNNVPEHLVKIGQHISEGWQELAEKHEIELEILDEGLPSAPTFNFKYEKKSQALRTLFTQEMLDLGYLASNLVYVSYQHQDQHIESYLQAVDKVFSKLKSVIEKGDIKKHLRGPVAHEGFTRLT